MKILEFTKNRDTIKIQCNCGYITDYSKKGLANHNIYCRICHNIITQQIPPRFRNHLYGIYSSTKSDGIIITKTTNISGKLIYTYEMDYNNIIFILYLHHIKDIIILNKNKYFIRKIL